MPKKQPTDKRKADDFAGPGSTADHLKTKRQRNQSELDRIMGKKK